jgi:hypothetical protein
MSESTAGRMRGFLDRLREIASEIEATELKALLLG